MRTLAGGDESDGGAITAAALLQIQRVDRIFGTKPRSAHVEQSFALERLRIPLERA